MNLKTIADDLHVNQGIAELILLCQKLKMYPDLVEQLTTVPHPVADLDKPVKVSAALESYLKDCQSEYFCERMEEGKIVKLSPLFVLIMQDANFPLKLVDGYAYIDLGDFYI